MKSCKKLLAVLVTLCMLMSSFAALAYANDPTAEERDAKAVVLSEDDLAAMEIDAEDIEGCRLGDYDGDEKVTAEDARLTLRSSVRLENRLSKERMFLVDVDRDRQITSADARLILRMSVGLEVVKTIEIEKPEIPEERYPDEKPVTINKLYQLQSDKFVFEALYYDDGMIRAIDGEFTSLKVNSIDDAILVFKQLSPLLGLKDEDDYLLSKDDILYSTTGTGDAARHYYRLNPTVNGVPVFGSDMILIVNNEGTPNGFHSAYNKNINTTNTVPTATASDAEAAVMEAFKDYLSESLDGAISTVPDATASDAEATATDAVKVDSSESSDSAADVKLTDEEKAQLIAYISDSVTVENSLVIYDADRSFPVLTWCVRLFSANTTDTGDGSSKEAPGVSDERIPLPVFDRTYFVYADGLTAGQVMRSFSNLEGEWEDSIETATDSDAGERTINVQVDGIESQLVDAARNIKTYQTLYNGTGGVIGSGAYIKPVLPGKIVTKGPADWDTKAFNAHYNLGKAYDFYAGLGRKSYDGNEAEIIDSIRYVPYEGTSAPTWLKKAFGTSNAFWSSNQKQFVFYDTGNTEAALDVVGHEYTHAVTNTIVGGPSLDYTLTYYGETGALNEAYSDILGSLIEGKTKDDAGRWLVGEDTGAACRNMSDPESMGQADNYADLADAAWKAKLDNYVDRDNEGVHIFSGVFSLAYYKMVTDNDTSCANTAHKHTSRTKYITDSQWATVFYNSLSHLEMNAKFVDARMAVINEARAAGFTPRQIQAIKDAFDDVGITGTVKYDWKGDWQIYEHEDYQFKYIYPQPENRAHSITINGKDVVMNGFNVEAYKDFLFKEDSDPSVKTFFFELVRDRTDWHSIEGAGFLFNTQIKDNTIEGYCILTTQYGLKLIRINPCDLDAFRNGNYNLVEYAGQLLTTVNIGDPYAVQSYVIRVSPTAISVICNGERVIDNYILPVESSSYGFGPITSHDSHCCEQLSYYTFSNIRMEH